jgi:hypothetical protein
VETGECSQLFWLSYSRRGKIEKRREKKEERRKKREERR